MAKSKAATAEKPAPKPRAIRKPPCSACGATNGDHVYGCPNYVCPECGMSGGNHMISCTSVPAPVAEAPSEEGVPNFAEAMAGSDETNEDLDEQLGPRHTVPVQKKGDRRRIDPPDVTSAQIMRLQEAIETRDLIAIPQPLSKALLCEEWHVDGDEQVGCTGYAAVAIVDETPCSQCEKVKKTRKKVLCVPHGCYYADGKPIDPQMSLLVSADA